MNIRLHDFKTTDLSDQHPEILHCEPGLINYGGLTHAQGPIRTVKCIEDNSCVRDCLTQPGNGSVLVVDATGSTRCAMLGDMLAEAARANQWAGIIIHGLVRDCSDLAQITIGIWALGCHPRKSKKLGVGEIDIPIQFHGVMFEPGNYLYADCDGIVVARKKL